MQRVSGGAKHYDMTTIAYHWATAVLVLLQWLGAQTIDWFPRGPLRVDARSFHIMGGVVLGVLLVLRIIWRLTNGRRLPLADQGLLNVVAKATHWGLYLLLCSMVLIGGFLTWTRGDSLFNLFSLPSWAPNNRTLADQVQEVHATIGWIILVLAGLHASAALIHRFLWHDGILDRMLPRSWRGRA